MTARTRRVLAPLSELRRSFRRATLGADARAGVVLGVESVPDGLASGLLAGVNPVAGLYSYLFGMVGGALFTGTAFMAVQSTGAMAIVVADVDLASRSDPERSLYTLALLTGVVMIVAGAARLGRLLRFVSTPVMTGFITAVGVNIVLGQLGNFTGYEAPGDGRVSRTVQLLLTIDRIDFASTLVGAVTVALILALQRTRLRSLGLVVAVAAGSGLGVLFGGLGLPVQRLADIVDVPRSLPLPVLPAFAEIPGLLVPALSLAFVGLVQGAGVSAGVPNPDGRRPDASQDFLGQGAGNLASGLFQGMPVGGSMSASSLIAAAGARTRLALLVAGVVMAVVILLLGGVIGYVAMPALAGLLIVVGAGSVRPRQVISVARTGAVQATVMGTTFVLTLIVPLQYAVLVGVGLSVVLHVVRQSSGLRMRQLHLADGNRMRETPPPAVVPGGQVVVLQPYGSIFFASAPALEDQLPDVTEASVGSAVILRMRGADDAGATFIDVLTRYSAALRHAGSRLILVTDSPRIRRQLRVTGALRVLGEENLYQGGEWVGRTLQRAHRDALAWVQERHGTDAPDA
ncbi:SulP family inorganic anion transporter [Pseudonocardia kunmingensis]|uniref:SulP family sulfate permease n=1 Tax=Pseudonocardia kunmingensis TaxID=630975 RepID=A0A543DWA4_9PSEU|nr:SulP family inorganic anion transporter [Pseudonocardia kunmingensis]TQM13627.1 SulP family sulfate permease [Pseudonocardia kunmingensis]